MANYATMLARTASTSASLGSLNAPASSMRRIKLYDIVLGSEASPADNAFLYVIQRITTAGTSTAVTPSPIDPADAASAMTAGQNHTIEPTYTAGLVMLRLPLNQRATFRWVAGQGGELVIPATASNGLGFQTPTSSAVVISATTHAQEQ